MVEDEGPAFEAHARLLFHGRRRCDRQANFAFERFRGVRVMMTWPGQIVPGPGRPGQGIPS
jgi:hypothetical protein